MSMRRPLAMTLKRRHPGTPRQEVSMTTSIRFEAEVLFLDPDGVSSAVAALASQGLEFKRDLDAVDECGPTVFGMVTGTTELREDDIPQFVDGIISPFSGDVSEWSYVPNPRTHRAEFIQAYGPEALRSTISFERPQSAELHGASPDAIEDDLLW
jgi:hypothetical protein